MGRPAKPKPDPLKLVSRKPPLAERDENGRQAPFKPTAEQRKTVKMLSAFGATADQIEKMLEVSRPTLNKYFQREMDTGVIEANAKVAEALYFNATKARSVDAQKFWLTHRGQWKPLAQQHEHIHDFRDTPVEDLEYELLTIRSRKRIAAGAGALAERVSEEPDGVLD